MSAELLPFGSGLRYVLISGDVYSWDPITQFTENGLAVDETQIQDVKDNEATLS